MLFNGEQDFALHHPSLCQVRRKAIAAFITTSSREDFQRQGEGGGITAANNWRELSCISECRTGFEKFERVM